MAALAAQIECVIGLSAHRKVLCGFAPAALLYKLSFADVLNEDTRQGYQRRFNSRHSQDFRRYIQKENSTTIPLTFNLRPNNESIWQVVELTARRARLDITRTDTKILAQVDCQHRLGHLSDSPAELPFMCFIGLSQRDEMEIFNVINSKAKGLSNSLLDSHDAALSGDLAVDNPPVFIALFLRNEANSPWYGQVDCGGKSTTGMKRRATLRTLQTANRRFLAKTKILEKRPAQDAARIILDFWAAVADILSQQWLAPRKHILTKGLGVYALMDIAADLYNEANNKSGCDKAFFAAALADFASDFDWSTAGPLGGFGGEGAVPKAVAVIREARMKARLKLVANG